MDDVHVAQKHAGHLAAGASAVSANAEVDQQDHAQADQCRNAQGPLHAEDVSCDLGGVASAQGVVAQGGDGLHEDDQDGCADSAGDLPGRVGDGRTGGNILGSQVVQGPGGQGHQCEAHADLADELTDGDQADPGVGTDHAHGDGAQQQDRAAGHGYRTGSPAVQQPASEELGDGGADGSWQHDQAAHGGREAAIRLDVHGQDDGDRAEGEEGHGGDDGAHSEVPDPQHMQVQQGLVMVKLAKNEPDDPDQSDQHEWPGHDGGDGEVLDVGEAEHEPAEPEDGQGHRKEVRLDTGVALAEVAQAEDGQEQRHSPADAQRQEDGTPAVGVGLPAAQGGADGRGHTHGQTYGAHGHAALGKRVYGEDGDLQDGPHGSRAYGLEDAAQQDQGEGLRLPAQQRTQGEDGHGGDDDLPGGETLGQKAGQRHHDAHDQLEYRGQPLAGGQGDVELVHYGGQGRSQL